MKNYKELVNECLNEGYSQGGRNGETLELFGRQLKFDLSKGFPIVTGRKMFYKGVFGELAAFLKGPSHIDDFKGEGCHYWDKFADIDGGLRLAYGNAWRDFHGVDQLENLLFSLKDTPASRRHLISAWDPSGLDQLTLQCCHYAYQWNVQGGKLNMTWVQRSADLMLGLPSDIILAALWNHLIAAEVGLQAGELTVQLGSVHIYKEHLETAQVYLHTTLYPLPRVFLKGRLLAFRADQAELQSYQHGPSLSFELKV